jgi:hypothetical protein
MSRVRFGWSGDFFERGGIIGAQATEIPSRGIEEFAYGGAIAGD